MADFAGWAVLLLVTMLLALGCWRQFVPLGPRGLLFDTLAIVPQWRFYAQSTLQTREDIFDDHHLIVRTASQSGEAGSWRALDWDDERRWTGSLWSPRGRSRGMIQHCMYLAAGSGDAGTEAQFHTSITYLTLLRHCFDHGVVPAGHALQFAVVGTRGRGARPLWVEFLSAWHIR